ncbi:MAG TPA: rRNA maturation RNase YbeY [Polyangiaceae bacterium]|nr:rRNA maturation RNase YbeY [Polyangiaceae bacterium]
MPAIVSIRNGPFRGVSRQLVRRWAERMLGCLDLSRAELSIAITDDREIRELNKVFRHRDRATDVLAFAMREGQPLGANRLPNQPGEMLGDVVVSVETARRQASQRRRPLEAEMLMLLAHGLLHLVGYDHQSERDEAIMTAETDRLCRAAHLRAGGRTPRAASTPSKREPLTSTARARRPSRAGARVKGSSSR